MRRPRFADAHAVSAFEVVAFDHENTERAVHLAASSHKLPGATIGATADIQSIDIGNKREQHPTRLLGIRVPYQL
ncbi:hypothetical protein AJ87_22780 [Rhizobium yanglingense]|nr:hypothetical protein AJ87_22780 [Rhizobium yanglingense]